MERKVVYTLDNGIVLEISDEEINLIDGENYVTLYRDYWNEFVKLVKEADKEVK